MAQRRRAPHRAGRRTTLTVPPEIHTEAERLAAELGTTTNDALIRLAGEGAAARERRARIAEIAAERAAAIDEVGGIGDAAAFPSPDDLRDAMLAGRRDESA
ncbi:hypothetical protein VSS74_12055 [Conexibacter stalactiti]|uniref:Ribbon-helix-helix protein CopG domain-containing protein n=1 Tax=Conexibacter stalactiti TaxID=1940611 RepID=A0ABU4HP77_9ACTN|nr:hypothetical protein [Conexibacter stalactiti]MDW5595077.1 hypothetical protein [Conexibacter stalactiti]MEC5035719.1 hypothetical protein [Conexibacter stalactiti]